MSIASLKFKRRLRQEAFLDLPLVNIQLSCIAASANLSYSPNNTNNNIIMFPPFYQLGRCSNKIILCHWKYILTMLSIFAFSFYDALTCGGSSSPCGSGTIKIEYALAKSITCWD